MKTSAAAGLCAIALGIFGCSADASVDEGAVSEDELRGSAKKGLRCSADSGGEQLALVPTTRGKFALLALTPAADLYALSRRTGALTTTTTSTSWQSSGSALTLGSNMKGKWKRGAHSTNVTCTAAVTTEAGSWRTAIALADYAGEIDGLADAVLESSERTERPKPYTVFVVETARRGSLALGQIARNSAGALPGSDDAESRLDENDFGHGAMSAAYSTGGGDDYGEWFQAASDGISLSAKVLPALVGGARAGFIAREKVTAIASLVGSAKPSAVEITVGPWTFFLPNAFPE